MIARSCRAGTLDGTKVYVHGVIDHFTRLILAFRVSDRFQVANALAVLEDAVDRAAGSSKETDSPMLVVDGGVENFNGDVDELVATGAIRRVLAQADIVFSNSLIDAFWRNLKHQCLFMNSLDTVAASVATWLSTSSCITVRFRTLLWMAARPTRSTSTATTTSPRLSRTGRRRLGEPDWR